MLVDIKNSSGKILGNILITEDKIEICNNTKPLFCITNKDDISNIMKRNDATIQRLYDEYTLTIAEIAALYGMPYHSMNQIINSMDVRSPKKAGRRNSSYAACFTEQRLQRMSESQRGHKPKTIYIRTPEIKQKISDSLKRGYQNGSIVQDPSKQSKAWADGKYKNVKMGRGIQGFFYSNKMQTDVYFRSLLELMYLLKIEVDNNVFKYVPEPFQINLPHNSHYTPDFIINDSVVVELKPHEHFKYENMHRFNLEMACLNSYCNKNKLGYVVVYDTDIGFESKAFRRYIKNHPEIIKQYNIRFKKHCKSVNKVTDWQNELR